LRNIAFDSLNLQSQKTQTEFNHTQTKRWTERKNGDNFQDSFFLWIKCSLTCLYLQTIKNHEIWNYGNTNLGMEYG